jgi:uncharacterized membrane protein YphA (DoxX/SURF4 family)
MAYSHSRLRKTLALVRMLTGAVFVFVGMFKVSSLEFARVFFPQFLEDGIQGAAVSWVRPILEWIVSFSAGRVGVRIGFLELFIGIALLLGLAVRPAALLGMMYSLGLFFATWNQAPQTPSMLQSAEHQFRNLFPFLVFLLLGVGHAGETWGLGSVYHHHRARIWAHGNVAAPAEVATVEAESEDVPVFNEVDTFTEFLEREERAMADTGQEWRDSNIHDHYQD